MASFAEICDLLGHSWSGAESKGRPSFIRKHLEEFSHHWSWMKDKDMMGRFFLNYHGKKLFNHPECSPRLPQQYDEWVHAYLKEFTEVADQPRILALVTQAFHDAQPKKEEEHTLESTLNTDFQELGAPPTGGESNKPSTDEQPTVMTEKKSDDLLGAVADGSATMASLSLVMTSSKLELVKILRDWIGNHPNIRIPELSRYDQNALEVNFATEALLAETDERVWILRLGVIDKYQGWVLEKPDGSSILVKVQYRKGGTVYHGWLGGERGYSEEIIAHHKGLTKRVLSLRLYAQERGLDPEDVLNEYDISEAALEADQPQPMVEGSQQSDSPLSSAPSDTEASAVIDWTNRKRRAVKGADMTPVKKAKAAKSKTARSSNLRGASSSPTPPGSPAAIRHLMQINDSQVRGNVKRLQKVFPKNSIAVSESVLLKNKGNFDQAIDDLQNLCKIPTSTDVTVSDDGQVTKAIRSSRNKGTSQQNILRTPSPSRVYCSSALQLGTPSSTDQSMTFGYPTPNTPSFRSFNTTATMFHMFLSDPAAGAIPIPFTSLTTKQKLFKEATSAYSLSSASTEEIIAASVMISGLNRAIVVRKDKAGNPAWEEVGRIVGEMEKMGQAAEVEVRCIVQPIPEVAARKPRAARD
ncbi:MAG: hypothetical protein Q9178_000188 [Gyalolechia marmorata]